MKAEQYQEKKEQLSGWPVRIVSYRLGAQWFVSVRNEEPGAWIVKEQGASLQEVESRTRQRAAEYLSKTRRLAPERTAG